MNIPSTISQFFTERFLRIWDRRWSFKKVISHKENQVNVVPNYVTVVINILYLYGLLCLFLVFMFTYLQYLYIYIYIYTYI